MNGKLTSEQLANFILGDLDLLAIVLKQPHAIIQECRSMLPRLVITTTTICKVLMDLQQHRITAEQAQKWASFVRRGYVAYKQKGPIKPIEIDYDITVEDLIADVISRLDEIGDLIDGTISEEKLKMMIRQLSDEE